MYNVTAIWANTGKLDIDGEKGNNYRDIGETIIK